MEKLNDDFSQPGAGPATESMSPSYKLYRRSDILVAALVSGPIGVAYCAYSNYKAVGKLKNARQTIVVAVLFLVAILIYSVVDQNLISHFFVFAMSTVTATVLQEGIISQHIKTGGQFYSLGQVFIRVFISSILYLFFLINVGVLIVVTKAGLTEKSADNVSTEVTQVMPVDSSVLEYKQDSGGGTDDTGHWLTFLASDLGISFKYPIDYGQPKVEYTLRALPGSGFENNLCRAGGKYVDDLACTGAIIKFDKPGEASSVFMVLYGRYTNVAPQGGWWGFQDVNQAMQLLPWSKNQMIRGEPNTKMYRYEGGGDTITQYIVFSSEKLSHAVIPSPIQFGAITDESKGQFSNHIDNIPPPPQYNQNQSWAEDYQNYVLNIEMFDVADDIKVQEFIEVLRTVKTISNG